MNRTATFFTFAFVFLLLPALYLQAPHTEAALSPTQPHAGAMRLADLPPGIHSAVAGALGREETAYQFSATADGYHADNPAHALGADFSRAGVRIQTGAAQWTISLRSIGHGDTRQVLASVGPRISANQLEYVRDGATEWYVNGPTGLEQGFTLTSSPRGAGGILTLTLALGGNVRPRLDDEADALDLVREDGTTVLRYAGLSASDATGRALPAWMGCALSPAGREEQGEVSICVDDEDAQYPLIIDPYVLQATLTNAGGAAGDQLGCSVAMSADGATVVAGAFYVNSLKGAAYVFVRPQGGWATTSSPIATLTLASGAAGDYLGYSVAVSSNGATVAVGAPNSAKGAVHVFVRPGGGWGSTSSPTATLTNAGGASGDYLGDALAMNPDGSTIVAGAHNTNSRRGAACVFVRPGGGWATTSSPAATLTYAGAGTDDHLGVAVAISPDDATVVAGAHGGNNLKGAVHVFAKPGGGWASTSSPTAILTNAGGAGLDLLGLGVAIGAGGGTIVAGAPGTNSSRGAAYVFARPSGGWATTSSPTATLTNAGGAGYDYLGISVAISVDGGTIVAGAQGVSSYKGAAYVFAKPGGGWASTSSPTATLTNPGGAANDHLGFATAISADGTAIIAGAPGVNPSKGSVCVFLLPDTTPPTATAFGVDSPSTSLNVPISSFTATDNVGVAGYLITTSSTAPGAGASDWSGTAPTAYSVPTVGAYTLCPWARDASGNVSSVFATPAAVRVIGVPIVAANAAADTTEDGVTLRGTVNAQNDDATVTFEYGETTDYGSSVAADQSPVAGVTDAAVSKAITGLSPLSTYHYRVVAVNAAGTTRSGDQIFVTTAPSSVTPTNSGWTLSLAAVPNPFSLSTTIRYVVPSSGEVALTVVDAAGRRLRTLVNGCRRPAGDYTVCWDGRDERGEPAAAGVYLALLRTSHRTTSKAVIRLK